MTYRQPARRTSRPIPTILVAGLLVVVAAIAASLGYPLVSSASSSPPTSWSPPASASPLAASPPAASRIPIRRSEPPRALGEADGVLPDGASVFDDETPAVANLDPSLLKALRRAARDAAKNGVEFQVNSGWRSRAYQEQLLREAIAEYGSEEEAERWVATTDTSAHVSGDAVDIGPSDATTWLSKHGARYGLCQIYRNESWHYELRPEATSRGCPRMYADSAHDPRTEH